MMKKVLLAATALAILLVPAAAAQDGGEESYSPSIETMMAEVEDLGSIDVSVSSKQIAFEWTGIQIGANVSSWLRGMVDELGDQNGTVEVAEMEQGESLLKPFLAAEMNALVTDTRSSGYFLIDTNNAQSVEVTSLVTEGMVGAVNSTTPIRLDFTAAFTFATQSKDVHTVKLDMGQYYFSDVNGTQAEAAAGDFALTIQGGDGWSIDADSIEPECAREAYDASSGAIVLGAQDIECFTGHSGLLIGFSISGGDDGIFGIPGFELPLLILGLIGGMVAIRRRA
jgi:hypothetical protein